jgi:hypothetical protein
MTSNSEWEMGGGPEPATQRVSDRKTNREIGMNKEPQPRDFYRVFAPGVPNVRVMSERLSEAEARSRKREILMAYPAAAVRIEKTDESGRNSRTPE